MPARARTSTIARSRTLVLACLVLVVPFVLSCSDDGTGPDGDGGVETSGELTVVLESQSEEIVTAVQTDERQISFCYADDSCVGYLEEEGVLESRRGTGGVGSTHILHTSAEGQEAVGAVVEFEVTRDGTGVVHVVDRRIEDDPFLDIDDLSDDEILASSEPFTGGDVVSLEVGTTN